MIRDFRSLLMSSELREVAEEVGRLFEDLDRTPRPDRQAHGGQCIPPLDVIETDGALEVVLDVPGVTASAVRVMIKKGIVLVVGEKVPFDARARADASFHLVERSFGRFARAVRLVGAHDTGRARARIQQGQLRITIPKIADRRGREILVPVEE